MLDYDIISMEGAVNIMLYILIAVAARRVVYTNNKQFWSDIIKEIWLGLLTSTSPSTPLIVKSNFIIPLVFCSCQGMYPFNTIQILICSIALLHRSSNTRDSFCALYFSFSSLLLVFVSFFSISNFSSSVSLKIPF